MANHLKQYFDGVIEKVNISVTSADCSGDGACGSTCGASDCSDDS